MVFAMIGKTKYKSGRTILILIGTLLCLAVATIFIFWEPPRNKMEFVLFERTAIEQSVRSYFQAEMEKNLPQVYAKLAPSSIYKQTHSYNDFLQEFKNSVVKIQDYRIVGIYRFRTNDNKASYPAVEKMVQVEVDVDLNFTDTDSPNTYNYCFTFMKEKGVWYKG